MTLISDDAFVRLFQERARAHGLFDGAIGGNAGPLTLAALDKILPPKEAPAELPWIAELRRLMGHHETTDNAKLRAWLKSDGKALGDPKELPWCGDAAETAVRRTLPDELFEGPMENPYWAQNWRHFGIPSAPVYGAVAVFSRSGGGGHVGFLVGESADNFYVLGGNQANAITIAPISKGRWLASRWPATFPMQARPLPPMSGGARSVNEA